MDPVADNKMITSSDNFVDVCRFNIGIFKILEKRPIDSIVLSTFGIFWNFSNLFHFLEIAKSM